MSRRLPRRIGINAIFLLPGMGGLDTYVRELVPCLVTSAPEASFSVYCSPEGERHLRRCDWAGSVRLRAHPLFGVRGLKALTETTLLGAIATREVDLIHSVALTAPLWTRAANVVTIADTTWLDGDRPDLTTRLWRALVPPIARRADRVIAISQHSAGDVVERLGVPSTRVDITPLGHRPGSGARPLAEPELRRRHSLGDGPIILMVGTRKPHKNVLGLLRAMPAVLQARPDAVLVLAGNPTAHEPELLAERDRLKLQGSALFLQFVDDEELEGLYAAADCLVLPSFNEGFGLPLLEAMGRGLPVACSNVSALPEVAGSAARYFDPTRPEQISAALAELLGDPELRRRLAAEGRRREASMTWEATAAATLDSYAAAWSAHRGRPAG